VAGSEPLLLLQAIDQVVEKTRHFLRLPGWTPAPLNSLIGCHWGTRSRRKRADREVVALEALAQGIPRATGRRRVSLVVTGWPTGRLPDADGLLKSTLDALVHAGLLVDDAPAWCELGAVEVCRGPRGTTIVLEDL
jgi:hypothetical protein